jgi:hypothetical protein
MENEESKEIEVVKKKITGRGGPGRGQGRKKGSLNRTPSRRLIEQAVCLEYGGDQQEIEIAKVNLLRKYLQSGDKGLGYFVEIMFGKPTDVVKMEAEIKVTAVRTEEDVDDLFDEHDDIEDDEDE